MSKYLIYGLTRLAIGLFALLPFPLLYRLSDLLRFLLQHLLHYRRNIIRQHLQIALPTTSIAEQRSIEQQFYHNLCDLSLESLKGLHLPSQQLRQRYQYKNPELLQQWTQKGQSIILVGAHLCNWEWGVLSVSLWLDAEVIGTYKPLSNAYLDTYFKERRSRWGTRLVPMAESARSLLAEREEAAVFVFFSDQSPSNPQRAHWLPFLNRETAFMAGVDKLARRTGFPVFFFDIHRVKRGYYEVTFKELELTPKQTKEGAITAAFAQQLEKRIQSNPPDWLWSHRRWKHQRPAKVNLIS